MELPSLFRSIRLSFPGTSFDSLLQESHLAFEAHAGGDAANRAEPEYPVPFFQALEGEEACLCSQNSANDLEFSMGAFPPAHGWPPLQDPLPAPALERVYATKRKRRVSDCTLEVTPNEPEKEHTRLPSKNPKNAATIRRRKEKRRQDRASRNFAIEPMQAARVVNDCVSMSLNLALESLQCTAGAYGGKSVSDPDSKQPENLEGLKAKGFQVFDWDGVTPTPLLSECGKVVAVLAGRPDDASYVAACESAAALMKEEATSTKWTSAEQSHARGSFPVVNAGFSHMNGTETPIPVLFPSRHGAIAKRVRESKEFERIATYQSSAFSLWSPVSFSFISNSIERLLHWSKSIASPIKPLVKNFARSIFPMFAVNFGPNAWTFKHKDVTNLPWAWCAITALGWFDPKHGGHIVLQEAKIVIEFPPGATVLIPSATFTHFNVPIAEGWRGSFTQYIPGGLIRWVDQGYKTQKNFQKLDPVGFDTWVLGKGANWRRGLDMLSTLEDLRVHDSK